MDHFFQPEERFAEDAGAVLVARGRLHAGAEHFDGTDDGGGGYAGDGAGEEGGVCVVYVGVYGTGWVRAEEVVAGEVDHVGGDGHDEGRA